MLASFIKQWHYGTAIQPSAVYSTDTQSQKSLAAAPGDTEQVSDLRLQVGKMWLFLLRAVNI